LIFLTSYEKRVLTIGIFAFAARNKFEWNYLLASALLSTIPVIILFLVLQKYLIKGLTAGAIK
jgi:ABC-type glycerol-3-phosphate transport system permease component